MIKDESVVQLAKAAGDVFAYVDDFGQYPRWMESCVELKQVSPGPRAVGARLHYRYNQGGRPGEMEGEVTAYEVDRALEMRFEDKMFGVEITFHFAPMGSGTTVTHSIAITPKGMMAKMMSPLIAAGNKKQVEGNLKRLKTALGDA